MPPRDWPAAVEPLTRTQKLVHLASRMQPEDASAIQIELFKQKRLAYTDTLTAQAAAVGCAGRRGVASPATLSKMMEEAKAEALGLINTYNYDLALAIRNIGVVTPRANRNTYAKRLTEWEIFRNEWKSKQVMLWNTVNWQDKALRDFATNNEQIIKRGTTATVEPKTTAICDVCREWVNKGTVPISKTKEVTWPAHLNCPHHWVIDYKTGKVDCTTLWVGTSLDEWFEEIGGKEVAEKGGPGSGNWGHTGRPGMVGGSGGSSSSGALRQTIASKLRISSNKKLLKADESDIGEDYVEAIFEWSARHDQKVLDSVQGIYVAKTSKDFKFEASEAGIDDVRGVAAFWNRSYKTIVLKPNISKSAQAVFDHEMGHAAWASSNNTKAWSRAWRNDNSFDRVTEYGRRGGVQEAFAETYMAYIAKGGKASGRYAAPFAVVEEVLNGLR